MNSSHFFSSLKFLQCVLLLLAQYACCDFSTFILSNNRDIMREKVTLLFNNYSLSGTCRLVFTAFDKALLISIIHEDTNSTVFAFDYYFDN